jgi:hypothetical protein
MTSTVGINVLCKWYNIKDESIFKYIVSGIKNNNFAIHENFRTTYLLEIIRIHICTMCVFNYRSIEDVYQHVWAE